jgi:hypothetical protein
VRDLRADPLLQICATDLATGKAVGISRNSTILLDTPSYERVTKAGTLAHTRSGPVLYRTDLGGERLATVVGASGAFPGAFNAVRLPRDAEPDDREPQLLLTDAGLTDNLGIDLLLERHYTDPRWQLDVVIISDGGQVFSEMPAARSRWLLDELPRALDVVYKRAGWHHVLPRKLPPMVFIRPGDFRDDPSLERFWKQFRETATLDATFRKGQANTLFELGQKLVQKNWADLREMLDAANAGRTTTAR